jgi:protein-L-isoaspartate O-methyltransferase
MDPGSQISDSGRLEPSKSLPASSPLDERTPPLPAPSPPRPKPSPAASPAKSSPWCGAPTPGRCWRSSASTIGRSKRPSPPRRARPFRGRRHGRRPRPSAAPLPCPAQTRSCSTRTWSSPSIRRAASTTRPALHAKLIEALGPKQGEGIVHVGAGAGYYSAILAELVDPAGQVTAVEFDAALAKRAKAISGRPNVRVVDGDGARRPRTPADGAYVIFVVAPPADRWIENLASDGRLVFPLGVPGPKRPNSGGRHSDRDAARAISTAYFVCAEGEFEADREEVERLRAAFDAGGLDTVRSLIWKRPDLPETGWFAGFVSRRSAMSAPDRTASGGFDSWSEETRRS